MSTVAHNSLKTEWTLGDRRPHIVEATRGGYLVVIRWSLKLTLVLRARLTSLSVAKAVVESIEKGGAIRVVNWARRYPKTKLHTPAAEPRPSKLPSAAERSYFFANNPGARSAKSEDIRAFCLRAAEEGRL